MPYISEGELKRVARAQRVFLSRLEFTRPEAYVLACNRALKDLLGADHAVFFETGNKVRISSEDTCRETLDFLARSYQRFESGLRSGLDPHFAEFVQWRLRRSSAVVIDFDKRASLDDSSTYHEHFVPAGLTYIMGPTAITRQGEGSVLLAFERKAHLYSEAGLRLLELTLPAFETGVKTHLRGGATDTQQLVKSSPLPLIVFSEGKEVCRNSAFTSVETAEPDFEQLHRAAADLAASLESGDEGLHRPCRHVVTASGSYKLVALFKRGPQGERWTVLLVNQVKLKLPGFEQVQILHKLSARQAQVALLLAEGLTDKQVAARLEISVNTARRHAEQLLGKLGLKTRSGVALRLLE